MPRKLTRASAVLLALVAGVLGPVLPAGADTTVHPHDMAGWAIDNQDLNGSPDVPTGTFVNGPGSPPLGLGSFRQRANTGDKQVVQTANFNGTALAGIEISYSTYTTDPPPTVLTTAINMSSDTDGDGLSNETLVFEPYEQATNPDPSCTLTQNTASATWQAWDADAGCWWSTVIGVGGDRFTISEYLADNPGATLATLSAGAFRLVVGSTGSSWPDFDGNVDNVTVNAATYDFETFSTTVNCDVASDDIAAVQAAVDNALSGTTLQLKGICDFTSAAAARTAVDAANFSRYPNPRRAGVLVRTGGLTITADAAGATILGSGDENAFYLAPTAEGVTIDGGAGRLLRFENLGQPIRAAAADGVAVRRVDITGGAGMWDGIVGDGYGADEVRYGADADADGLGDLAFTPASDPEAKTLDDFTAEQNRIVFTPASSGALQAIGIEIVGCCSIGADNLTFTDNEVTHQGTDYATFDARGISIWPISAPISNVTIDDNQTSGGSVGIVVHQTEGFAVRGNVVDVREYGSLHQPQGGILVADSEDGVVGGVAGAGNAISVVPAATSDPTDEHSNDFGAIGVVDDVVSLFGDPMSPDPYPGTPDPTRDVRVLGNTVSTAARGILLNGASNVVVSGNTVDSSLAAALSIARPLNGGRLSPTGPQETTVDNPVSDSVACANSLDGSSDDASEVAFGAGSSNAFPGGEAFAGNAGCVPTLAASPAVLDATSTLSATGRGWPNRPVSVRVSDSSSPVPNVVTKGATAGADGSYTIAFAPGEIAALFNGTLRLRTTASDPTTGISAQSAERTVLKDTGLPAAPSIVTPAQDATVPALVALTGTSEPGTLVTVREAGSTIATATANASGNWAANRTLAGGPHTIIAFATDGAGNAGPETAPRSFTVDATPPADPVIISPTEGATVPSNDVTISGSAEAGALVRVREGTTQLGTDDADGGGAWAITARLAEGFHTVVATATDGAGNASPGVLRTFLVKTDLVAPAVPVITDPPAGSVQPSTFAVRGRGEAGIGIRVYEGSVRLSETRADVTGVWQANVVLESGSHTLTAAAFDLAGNESARSASLTLTVDARRPTLVITTPDRKVFLPGESVVIEGTAEDDTGVAAVRLEYFDVVRNTLVLTQSATLTPTGPGMVNWSASPSSLPPGYYAVRATAEDVPGNRSRAARSSFVR